MTLLFGEPTRSEIPTVITDRLVLRGWYPADVAPYTAMSADPVMARHTGSYSGEAAVWSMFAFQIGHWSLRGYGMWVAADRVTGEFVGRVGLYEELGWPGLEVAWTIRADRWGQGLATEGGTAALEFAFTTTGRDEVVSVISQDNAASIRVAEKLGLSFSRTAVVHGRVESIYAISREEWTARQAD